MSLPLIIYRWSCLAGWQTWATPVTWTPQCSVCALYQSSKLHSEGGFSAFSWSIHQCKTPKVKIDWFVRIFCLNPLWSFTVFCGFALTNMNFLLPGIQVLCDHQGQMHHHNISQQVWGTWNYECCKFTGMSWKHIDAYKMNVCTFVSSALRDLYETMDKTSSSLPPIILLQFLHMAFPQFAEKGDQGQYLQQVRNSHWNH